MNATYFQVSPHGLRCPTTTNNIFFSRALCACAVWLHVQECTLTRSSFIEENNAYKIKQKEIQRNQPTPPGMPSQDLMAYWGEFGDFTMAALKASNLRKDINLRLFR